MRKTKKNMRPQDARRKSVEQRRIKYYESEAKPCLVCKNLISFENKRGKFCNRKCSAKFNNDLRTERARREHKDRICKCGLEVSGCNKFCDTCIDAGNHIRKNRTFNDCSADPSRRRYLLAECGNFCNLCELREWKHEPIPLIMDHIDGNSENNIRDNLRLICPNCDALLPTYKGRNAGKGRVSRRQRYVEGKSY